MKINRSEKKAEAVRRMELLGVYSETIQQFEKYDCVSNDFEDKYNALVYMVVRSYYEKLGQPDSCLFVDDDRRALKNAEAFVYVYNYKSSGHSLKVLFEHGSGRDYELQRQKAVRILCHAKHGVRATILQHANRTVEIVRPVDKRNLEC